MVELQIEHPKHGWVTARAVKVVPSGVILSDDELMVYAGLDADEMDERVQRLIKSLRRTGKDRVIYQYRSPKTKKLSYLICPVREEL